MLQVIIAVILTCIITAILTAAITISYRKKVAEAKVGSAEEKAVSYTHLTLPTNSLV